MKFYLCIYQLDHFPVPDIKCYLYPRSFMVHFSNLYSSEVTTILISFINKNLILLTIELHKIVLIYY